jgi:hypothetical protein
LSKNKSISPTSFVLKQTLDSDNLEYNIWLFVLNFYFFCISTFFFFDILYIVAFWSCFFAKSTSDGLVYFFKVVIEGFKSYREQIATEDFSPKVNCVGNSFIEKLLDDFFY